MAPSVAMHLNITQRLLTSQRQNLISYCLHMAMRQVSHMAHQMEKKLTNDTSNETTHDTSHDTTHDMKQHMTHHMKQHMKQHINTIVPIYQRLNLNSTSKSLSA